MIKQARNLININIYTRATHLTHPQTLTGEKWKFLFFSDLPVIWDMLDENSPKQPKMTSQTPKNGPHMLKTFQIFDFQPKIIR